MRNWRKVTWAIVIWTFFMVVWIVAGTNAANSTPVTSDAQAAGRAIGTGIGVSLLIMLWFIGFIVTSVIWFMSRPKNSVVVYGPQGQQMMVAEGEAKKRVTNQGWTYQPQGYHAHPPTTPPQQVSGWPPQQPPSGPIQNV